MSRLAPIQDIRELCNLYIMDVFPSSVLAIFITIAVINSIIFFSLWLPLIISLNIQSHHRLKRLSGICLRHRLACFFVWPFLHSCCGLSLILQGLVLHAGLACTHPGVEKRFYSLTPLAGWVFYASQCTILVASALTIGICLRKEQKRVRKGKGRATAGGDVEQHDAEPFAMPPQDTTLRTSRILGRADNFDRPSTVTTNSSASSRPEYFCWEGIEDLTKNPFNAVPKSWTRDPRDADPDYTYAMARRTMARTSSKVTMEDMQQPKRVRLPIGGNAEGSSKDVERLMARRKALAAAAEGFPFPCTPPLRPPPRCLSRAGVLGTNGSYIPLASEAFEGHSGGPREAKRVAPKGSGSIVPSRPGPLRIDSGYQPMSGNVTATVDGSCRLDRLGGKRTSSESVVFELNVPPSENGLKPLSRVTTSSSASGLEPLEPCLRLPSSDTRLKSPGSGVGLNELG